MIQNKTMNTVISIMLIFLLAPQLLNAQKSDSISIPGIPYLLTWNNYPLKYTLIHDELIIESGPKTDMFRDPNVTYNTDNAPKLLFTADKDFVFSTSIQHPFKNKWDGGAIVLMEDSLNWVKFCFEKDYTGANRVVSVVTKDISDDCNAIEINDNKAFFKMAKAGNVITLYYSHDGVKWLLIRHFQFNNKKPIKIGFLAQSPTGENCEVKFSKIQYTAKRIKDPYAGE
jgi:regulation of enolase protein 1 (concanavalin A-like superfamily)